MQDANLSPHLRQDANQDRVLEVGDRQEFHQRYRELKLRIL